MSYWIKTAALHTISISESFSANLCSWAIFFLFWQSVNKKEFKCILYLKPGGNNTDELLYTYSIISLFSILYTLSILYILTLYILSILLYTLYCLSTLYTRYNIPSLYTLYSSSTNLELLFQLFNLVLLRSQIPVHRGQSFTHRQLGIVTLFSREQFVLCANINVDQQ